MKESAIALQTRNRNNIPNSQSHEISAFEKAQAPYYERKFPHVKFRTPPNPIYNCHGLTFASKRTGISLTNALQTIIHDDGYTIVNRDEVLPGDIIIYYSEDGDIEHSGIVVSERDKQWKMPLVVSKWGKYSEVVHLAYDCPYTMANARYYRVTKWD